MAKATKKKMVTVTLPRDPLKRGIDADYEYFSVNFDSYRIKTDVPVMVPEEVAEVIENVKKARIKKTEYERKVAFRGA